MTTKPPVHHEWLGQAVTPEEAVRHIKSGDHVFLHSGCATSLPLEEALAEYGKTLRERAEALIAIAHPDHRAELRAAAAERKLVAMSS